MKERSGIIVWLHSTKNIKALRRFGSIYYYSRRLKYVSMYCDLDERDEIIKRLEKLRFVKRVDVSFLHEIKREYSKKKGKDQYGNPYDLEDPLTLLPS
ncbi:YlbG family protein [Pullulanibacillus sp. KACC 23026]|uniref:YlbG family protein n=1 Tax=Pullulanibacillus sp. KACC 23026 TaxID=3028315 RepID=UPI0023AF5845|nr:YlbG family protein [Pullulanibacillus sp. KACC 23026]WEG11687.1 YlbG family protein [Pullulanibacillus sp. KACC 23026]